MKKWLYPVVSAMIFAFLLIFIFAVGVGGNGDGSGFVGAIISILLIIVCLAIIPPAAGFIYSKRCLTDQKNRVFFTFYQSFMVTLPYLVLFFEGSKTLLYALAVFAWSELWSLLGLVNLKRKDQEQKA